MTASTLLQVAVAFLWTHVCLAYPAYYDVRTALGVITGSYEINNEVNGHIPISKFEGIPYARPPVRELRFKRPVSMGAFKSPYKATSSKPYCFGEDSHEEYLSSPYFSEDCLYLDIYVSGVVKQTTDAPQPVVVMTTISDDVVNQKRKQALSWIRRRLIMEEHLIVVVVNHRRGILGYLKTETGDLGLYDQRLALLWVHANIRSFNGDPTKVILLGMEDGTEDVLNHLILLDGEPKEKEGHEKEGKTDINIDRNERLFNRIITMQSRFPSVLWPSRGLYNFEAIARKVGCYWQDDFNTIDCLQFSPLESLFRAVYEIKEEMYIERESSSLKQPFSHFILKPNDERFSSQSSNLAEIFRKLLRSSLDNISDYSTIRLSGIDAMMGIEMLKSEAENCRYLAEQFAEQFQLSVKGEQFTRVNASTIALDKWVLTETLAHIYNVSRDTGTVLSDILLFHYMYLYKDTETANISDKGQLEDMTVTLILCDILSLVPLLSIADLHSSLVQFDTHSMYVYQHSAGLVELFEDRRVELKHIVRAWGSFAKQGSPNYARDSGKGTRWRPYSMKARFYFDVGELKTDGVPHSRLLEPISSVWRELVTSVVSDAVQINQSTCPFTGSDVTVNDIVGVISALDQSVICILTTVVVTLLVILGITCVCLYKGSYNVYRESILAHAT